MEGPYSHQNYSPNRENLLRYTPTPQVLQSYFRFTEF